MHTKKGRETRKGMDRSIFGQRSGDEGTTRLYTWEGGSGRDHLCQQVDGHLLLGGGVKGQDREATVEVVSLGHSVKHHLRDLHHLRDREHTHREHTHTHLYKLTKLKHR